MEFIKLKSNSNVYAIVLNSYVSNITTIIPKKQKKTENLTFYYAIICFIS
jgi:hypothetical protein